MLPADAPVASKFLLSNANGFDDGDVWFCTAGLKSNESRNSYWPIGALDCGSTLDDRYCGISV